MTGWKADLDALVQESTAFTKSIRVEPTIPRIIVEPNRMPPVNLNNSERDEIRQRVANFKAHQERFARERDCSVPDEKDAGAVVTVQPPVRQARVAWYDSIDDQTRSFKLAATDGRMAFGLTQTC
jgi:hypothetical protein